MLGLHAREADRGGGGRRLARLFSGWNWLKPSNGEGRLSSFHCRTVIFASQRVIHMLATGAIVVP
jgi:hypothetical protein